MAKEIGGFWVESLQRLRKNRGAVIGFIVIVIISILAIFGPMMNSYDYNTQDLSRSNLPPLINGLERIGFDGTDSHGNNVYEAQAIESGPAWLGTDEFGRDLWTRVWRGTQISMLIALVAAFLYLLIGVIYGSISAFYGGKIDNFMQRDRKSTRLNSSHVALSY